MNARQLVESTFLSRFFQEGRQFVGVELEFPLLAKDGGSVHDEIITGLPAFLLENGFKIGETDIHGNGVFLVNADDDCLSFDNSYNNFEFAMAKSKNLLTVAHRFYALFDLVQSYLLPKGHTLSGLGTNPHHEKAETKAVDYPIYRTLRRFLSDFSGGYFHRFPDFPAWLSSIQTHLDVDAAILPKALTLFASMDFVRGLLFANSLPFPELTSHPNTLCFRDYLWEHSGFGCLADNTGPVCGNFQTLDDITDMICKKSMFLTYRNGNYDCMPPVELENYFDTQGIPDDMDGYLSFKNVEITRRGTLEVRSDCAQPIGSAFAPAAFNLGIFLGLSEAEELLTNFFALLPPEYKDAPKRNMILRRLVINGEALPVNPAYVKMLLMNLVSLAENKLKERGFGEEQLLEPLAARATQLTCPAGVMRNRLAQGDSLLSIITDYADPSYRI